MDEVQATTRLAKAAVGDVDGSGILVRRFHIEVEPSGEPPRKPISEIALSREDLERSLGNARCPLCLRTTYARAVTGHSGSCSSCGLVTRMEAPGCVNPGPGSGKLCPGCGCASFHSVNSNSAVIFMRCKCGYAGEAPDNCENRSRLQRLSR